MSNLSLLLQIKNTNLDLIFDYSGAMAFCLGGASMALRERMDYFGVFVLAVISGFGGGLVRDIILGNTPPVVFKTPAYWIIALIATTVAILSSIFIQDRWKMGVTKKLVYLFDAFGLAFFTMVGIKAGLAKNLYSYQCVMMGVLTSSFGGVLRDIVLNRVPSLFQEDIYAILSIFGGVFYFSIGQTFIYPLGQLATIILIFMARVVVIARGWNLHDR